ncbi:MAG: hypothetical protein AB7J28_15195 [Hyphomonadaceae bacterium]
MDHFGWIADELTWLEETLDDPKYSEQSPALKRALQRAFVEACKAGRAHRHRLEAAAALGSETIGARTLRRSRSKRVREMT